LAKNVSFVIVIGVGGGAVVESGKGTSGRSVETGKGCEAWGWKGKESMVVQSIQDSDVRGAERSGEGTSNKQQHKQRITWQINPKVERFRHPKTERHKITAMIRAWMDGYQWKLRRHNERSEKTRRNSNYLSLQQKKQAYNKNSMTLFVARELSVHQHSSPTVQTATQKTEKNAEN